MRIDKNIKNGKLDLLTYFRSRANEIFSELNIQYSTTDFKKNASAMNNGMIKSRDNLLSILDDISRAQQWTNKEILECVLMITYTNDVVMLEARNDILQYEYMSFSRRIGELWEPFC